MSPETAEMATEPKTISPAILKHGREVKMVKVDNDRSMGWSLGGA